MPRELMTIRLDPALRRRLRSAATRRGATPSAAARAALEAWLQADERDAQARPFEALADLLGSVRSAPRNGSRRARPVPRKRRRRSR